MTFAHVVVSVLGRAEDSEENFVLLGARLLIVDSGAHTPARIAHHRQADNLTTNPGSAPFRAPMRRLLWLFLLILVVFAVIDCTGSVLHE